MRYSGFAWGTMLVVMAMVGCGSPAPSPDAGGGSSDSGTTVDSGTIADSGAALDSGTPAFPTHDCMEGDYVDRSAGADDTRTIGVVAGASEFDVPCMTVRAGQSVTFDVDFTMHPLGVGVAPGHRGTSTEPSPIEPQTTGTSYDVAFPAAGDYAFYCTTHFHSSGMYGVVRVLP